MRRSKFERVINLLLALTAAFYALKGLTRTGGEVSERQLFKPDPSCIYNVLQGNRKNVSISQSSSSATLIIGAGSSVGNSLATHLHMSGRLVTCIEDYLSMEMRPTREKWFYLSSLHNANHDVSFADLSDSESIRMLLRKIPNLGTLVYIVPTPHLDTSDQGLKGPPNFSLMVSTFIRLLHAVICSRDEILGEARVVLIIPPSKGNQDGEIKRELVQLFELVLLSYRSSFGMKAVTVQITDCSDENCDSVDDLVSIIGSTSTGPVTLSLRHSSSKALRGVKNVIFSTYFTQSMFKRPHRENSFQYLKGFFMTAIKHNARMVIFYDEARPKFLSNLQSYYSNIEFIQYTGDYHHRTINDGRFYIMYEYMLQHPEINQIILQDLRDGIFLEDPFKVMEIMGDYLYVGTDIPFKKRMPKNYKGCEHTLIQRFNNQRLYPMLNAGTLGGTWESILSFLVLLTRSFEDVFPANKNCNMDAVDFVSHKYFYDSMFSGYPFQGVMEAELASPLGIAVRHKKTRYDN